VRGDVPQLTSAIAQLFAFLWQPFTLAARVVIRIAGSATFFDCTRWTVAPFSEGEFLRRPARPAKQARLQLPLKRPESL
jgi:hypothetical protein